jgi:hypothetical protein
MKGLRSVLLATAVASGLGCPVYHLNRLPSTTSLAQPIAETVAGDFVHASGIRFAQAYEDFVRVSVTRYDTAGLDYGVGYNRPGPQCPAVATFYVHPAPRMHHLGAEPASVRSLEASWLAEALRASRTELENHHPTARLRHEGPCQPSPRRTEPRGLCAVYDEGSAVAEVQLFLHAHDWFVKYRFTFPRECEAAATRSLERLTANLDWPAS